MRGLRGDDRDGWLLRVTEMLVQRRGELGESAEERGLGLLGVIGANGADWSFVALRHIGVGIPEPFDGAGTLNKRCGDFSFEESGFVLGSAAGDLVEVQFALQSGFLDEHGLTGLLGGEGIPEDVVVQPPGVIGGEVDGLVPRKPARGGLECRLHPGQR